MLDGEYRLHTHEYPHTPGGANEKLGRRLYHVRVRGNFQATFAAYPNLYPLGLNTMRGYFEQGATLDFTHPTVGKFPAFIVRWSQVKDPKIRSGEKVDIEFLEDQPASFAVAQAVGTFGQSSIGPAAQDLATDLSATQSALTLSANDVNLFDALQGAVQDVLAIQDTRSLYGNLYGTKVAQVISLCQQLDQSMNLQDARAWPVVDDLQVVWLQAIKIQNDLQNQRISLKDYIVPFTMPLVQIAINLYGDASKQGDLLSLNADRVNDPMRVPAGVDIRYYPPSPQDQAASFASA